MGWFGFGGRKSAGEGSPSPTIASTNGNNASDSAAETSRASAAAGDVGAVAGAHDESMSLKAETAVTAEAFEKIRAATEQQQQQPDRDDEGAGGESGEGAGAGYADRLKAAVLDCVDTARRAPETFEEALAVIKGERAVKPDYERAASTVGAAFAGGCAHGWWNGGALAVKYPPHQRRMVRLRAGAAGGLRIATFALIFESSSAVMEALRRKKDFVGGTVGGALAGMAYGVSGGVAAARRGLFYGVWLGGMFGMFRNHVASLKEQAQLAAEEERLAQEEKEARGRSALKRSIAGLDAQLKNWPVAADPSSSSSEEPKDPKLAPPQRK